MSYIAHNYGSNSDRGIINEPNNGKISSGKTSENLSQFKLLTTHTIKISSDITQDQKEIITKASKEVLGRQTDIIFKEKNKEVVATSHSNNCNTNPEPEPAIPCSPLWQKIRFLLKKRFADKGEAIDKSWFSKLDIKVNEEYRHYSIKCPNPLIRDWIKNNYETSIEKTIRELLEAENNITKKDLLGDIGLRKERDVMFEFVVC